MSDRRKRRIRAIGAGIGVGAAVTSALFVLALIGLSGATTHADNNPPWVKTLRNSLAQRGFDWIDIDVADRVATVSGQAPDVDSLQYGFDAAEQALGREPEVSLVVDATHLEGGPAGVGAALQALGAAPDLAACQQAFTATLDGRSINFTPGSAALDGDNRRLLDTLAGVALRCHAFRVEIAGHTDLSGSAQRNQMLSEARAGTVRDYLVGKGVMEGSLTAAGYGSTRPVDLARTPEADARNRRIEFTVAAI
ncbi:MAG: OmpA family protein [Caulobacteraceae bacterium]|nr:MAG: OmpA family protein [Caulobacteraceae bacterium]